MTKEVHQHIYSPVHGHVIGGNLTLTHTVHHHGPVHLALAFGLKPDEAALLHNYRHSPKASQDILRHTSAAFAQSESDHRR